MAIIKDVPISVSSWGRGMHPTRDKIMNILESEGYRPQTRQQRPNYRLPVRSQNYDRVIYVLEGSIEITFPDNNEFFFLKTGDRIDIPAGVRHGMQFGASGANFVEAAARSQRIRIN